MKTLKFFLLLSFTLLFVTNIFGQAAVDIPLIATESNNPVVFQLAVGLDLTATNCIDTQLGESSLPPIPPVPVFEVRFELISSGCTGLETYKDYRAPGNPPAFPFTGIVQHSLLFWTSAPALPIDINYNLPPGALMRITDQIGGMYLNLGPFSGQGTTTIPGSYTALFVRAYLIMEYDNIIPVELTSFTASVLQNEKAIQLNWTTATETNNSGFEIQRTSPLPSPYQGEGGEAERGWEKIGFVPGFGTTTEPKSYSFVDENVTSGNYTYRLKQIDFDGTFTYSNEIEVVVDFTPKEFVLYQNYPNPFNPSTVIKYEIPGQARNDNVLVVLKVYDVLGNKVATLVNEDKLAGEYEVKFSAKGLPSGIYFYKLQAGSFIEIKKMILLK